MDGVDVRDIDEHYLRDAIAVVPQKVLLFSGTIEKICAGVGATRASWNCAKAAKVACAVNLCEDLHRAIRQCWGRVA